MLLLLLLMVNLQMKMKQGYKQNCFIVKQIFEELEQLAVKETQRADVFVVPGLGRLVRTRRKERMGRNPATGQAIKIPAKDVVKFRLAKSAKDAIVPPK